MATKQENERLAVVETKVDGIASDVTEIKTTLLGLDNKYAPKWVATAVAFFIGLVIAGFITAIGLWVYTSPDQIGERTSQTDPSTSTTTTTNTPTGSTSTTRNGEQTGTSQSTTNNTTNTEKTTTQEPAKESDESGAQK